MISGGPSHDFPATSEVLVDLLGQQGVTSTVFDDPGDALTALASAPDAWDLLTVNALRWNMEAERYAPARDQWAFSLSDRDAETIEHHVRTGGGLLACHTAVICFDANPRWAACIGATWNWDRSSHPPRGPASVAPTSAGRDHPVTAGIGEFMTLDEIYCFLDHDEDLVPLLTSDHGGVAHPVLWARTLGLGRVVTDVLGHDEAAMAQPEHAEVLQRAARWLTASHAPTGQPADLPWSTTP